MMMRSRYGASKRSFYKNTHVLGDETSPSLIQVVAFLIFNILFAYLSRQSDFFSTLYGWGVLFLGIVWLLNDETPIRVIYICCYIVGAELIWRSTGSGVFYEYGKYAVSFLLILTILRFKLLSKTNKWPFLYFILLLPSIILLPYLDRYSISFFLSGPLVLAVSTMFFSAIHINVNQVKKLLLAVIGPTVGIASLALYSTITSSNLVFTTESNFITSGGFGPVQISLQLGFGALLAFYYVVYEKNNRLVSLLMLVLAIWLISQSVFTFSRSGIYNSVIALLIGALFLFRTGRHRVNFILVSILTVSLLYWVVFPAMDEFTNGVLAQRFQDTSNSGREKLARADWQAFIENPVFGLGPGQALRYHVLFGMVASSHTEYTRMLAEHGSLGLLSLLILVGFVVERFFKKLSPAQKAITIMMTAWSLLYLLNTTMRTAAPGFIFGLGGAIFEFDKENSVNGK